MALSAGTAQAQGRGAGSGWSVGVTLGGISRYGILVEYFDDDYGVELNAGTWRFGDLSVSVVGKRYFRASTPHPYVGAGLWVVSDDPPAGRRALAAILRVPLGLDWRFAGRHHLGAVANLNRALYVRRPDPGDDTPVRGRIVPLPGLYYRVVF